jgi:hypothetical protein
MTAGCRSAFRTESAFRMVPTAPARVDSGQANDDLVPRGGVKHPGRPRPVGTTRSPHRDVHAHAASRLGHADLPASRATRHGADLVERCNARAPPPAARLTVATNTVPGLPARQDPQPVLPLGPQRPGRRAATCPAANSPHARDRPRAIPHGARDRPCATGAPSASVPASGCVRPGMPGSLTNPQTRFCIAAPRLPMAKAEG